ncbi:MAG: T9SS type A sorting domain-containing protein [Saprospiraceae bacterium]
MNALKSFLTILLLIVFSINSRAQTEEIRSFMFGHSLLDHRPPIISTPSDETTIAHWISLLAEEANKGYAATGQYGFLPQHANLPPFAQWGYDIVPAVWDSDYDTFDEADFNNALITAGNFMQWQGPDEPIPGQGAMTVISATETIVDWLDQQEDTMGIYIYENWPDMAPYLNNGFPATATEFDNYNDYVLGDFHDWWLDYHDALLDSRPELGIRMIPVGPILAELLSDGILSNIPITELYEDDAPHGRATLYFLAGLITYTAIYQMEAPLSYEVPSIVHQEVQDNYAAVACYISDYLMNFTDDEGINRALAPESPLPVELVRFSASKENYNITLTWETASEINNEKFEIEHSVDGERFVKIGTEKAKPLEEAAGLYQFIHRKPEVGNHYYRLKQIDLDGTFEYSEVVAMELLLKREMEKAIYPNPSLDGFVQLNCFSEKKQQIEIVISNFDGTLLIKKSNQVDLGNNVLYFNFSDFESGVYLIKIKEGEEWTTHRLVLLE